MRRVLINIVGFLVLAAGPALPYFHLTTSPHRFCPQHRSFEVVHHRPWQPPPPEDSRRPDDDDHETCLIATLILQLIDHRPAPTPLAQRPAPHVNSPAMPPHLSLLRKRDVVALAPKTSPPPFPHV
jgi:hypothetical protein